MRIFFIRHGHPDYANDCLTELGHLQAEAAAKRLQNESFDEIYSSTRNRAYETALHIAKPHGIEVEQLEFIREIGWGSIDDEPLPEKGHPWFNAWDMVKKNQDIHSATWDKELPFCRNRAVKFVEAVQKNIDQWLAGYGYEREGKYYRIRSGCDKTIAVVSHAGSSSAALGWLFNIPFPAMCASISPDLTGITIVEFIGEPGSLIAPRLRLFNDARHIQGIEGKAVIEQ